MNAERIFDSIVLALDGVQPALARKVKRNRALVLTMIDQALAARAARPHPLLNTVLATKGRGKAKHFIIIEAKDGEYDGKPAQFFFASALGGGTNGSVLRGYFPGYDAVVERTRLTPMWYGRDAAKRYADYVSYMTKADHVAQIAPFVQVDVMPEELPDRAPDDADPDVVIRHTVAGGTVAEYDREQDRARPRDASVYSVLRHNGFVVVHSLDGILRYVNSVGLPRSPVDVDVLKWNRLARELRRLGLRVAHEGEAVDLATAAEVRKEALEERAEALGERAERLEAEARRAYAAATGIEAKRLTDRGIAGYFPTPPDVARRAVDMLAPEADEQILEPSAGDGALVRAVWAAEPSAVVDAIEPSSSLQAELRRTGVPIVAFDVNEYDPGTWYDGVIMNPPFEDNQALTHTIRAFEAVRPGGRLVAILPESVWFRTDRAHTAFRSNVLDRYLTDEVDLPAQAYGAARSIKTRIVRLDKPTSAPLVDGDPNTEARIERARAATPAGGMRPVGAAGGASGERSLDELQRELAGLVRSTRNTTSRAEDKAAAGYQRALAAVNAAIAAASRAGSVAQIAAQGGRGSSLEQGKSSREVELERQAARRAAPPKPRSFATDVRAAIRSAVRKLVDDGPVALRPDDHPAIVVADGDGYRMSMLEIYLPLTQFDPRPRPGSVALVLPGGTYGSERVLARRDTPADAKVDDYVNAAIEAVREGASRGKPITREQWAQLRARR